MAQLQIDTDMFRAGTWTLRSDHLAALAATCDALVQSLGWEGESLAIWGRHYDEQGERAEDAYSNERQLLGPHAKVGVIALPREPRPHMVWIDRLHLVSVSARPQAGSQLLGLYVGTNGRIVLAVHHPSVTAQIQQFIQDMPNSAGAQWDSPEFVEQCRVVLSYDADTPDQLSVRAPGTMALAVQEALTSLQGLVTPW